MKSSRIDCVKVNSIGCEYYDEDRLCADNCPGFILSNIIDIQSPETIILKEDDNTEMVGDIEVLSDSIKPIKGSKK